MGRAPRLPLRRWARFARGALLASCPWLAVLAPGPAAAVEIASARYDAPTTRYAHGVLGDAVEWGALVLTLSDGREVRATLPQTLVFEDIAPRLADLDGDGAPEVVTVESALASGARLAVWDETGRIAATAHMGQRNRWLAPVGAADLDGDGAIEIAYVDRPHLARTLRIVRFVPGPPARLENVASHGGVSNHRIGWDHIVGGLRDCGSGPRLVLADGDWRTAVEVWFDAGRLVRRDLGIPPTRDSLAAALRCE